MANKIKIEIGITRDGHYGLCVGNRTVLDESANERFSRNHEHSVRKETTTRPSLEVDSAGNLHKLYYYYVLY